MILVCSLKELYIVQCTSVQGLKKYIHTYLRSRPLSPRSFQIPTFSLKHSIRKMHTSPKNSQNSIKWQVVSLCRSKAEPHILHSVAYFLRFNQFILLRRLLEQGYTVILQSVNYLSTSFWYELRRNYRVIHWMMHSWSGQKIRAKLYRVRVQNSHYSSFFVILASIVNYAIMTVMFTL